MDNVWSVWQHVCTAAAYIRATTLLKIGDLHRIPGIALLCNVQKNTPGRVSQQEVLWHTGMWCVCNSCLLCLVQSADMSPSHNPKCLQAQKIWKHLAAPNTVICHHVREAVKN